MRTIIKRLRSEKRGVSNVLVVMLSLILITVIVANVVLWSYQMNQLDIERMHESVSITKVSHLTHSKWFTAQNEFSVRRGNRIGGSYIDTRAMDGFHETFMEDLQTVHNYSYPSSYSLLGGTSLISGSLLDLQSSDGVYMILGSYATGDEAFVDQQSNVDGLNDIGTHSSFNAMMAGPDGIYDTLTEQKRIIEAVNSKTNAIIAYRSNTGINTLSSPKSKVWTGDSKSLSDEFEMPTAGSPVRWVRVEYCPVQSRGNEVIVMTISDDRYYDLYIWNGTQWLVFNNIGYYSGTTFYRGFDVAYEHSSGRALIVYSRGTATEGQEIGYRIWDGNTLSPEYQLGSPYTTGIVYWINLASCPGTRPGTADDNEIAMIFIDSNADVFGYIWTGSAWNAMGQTTVWDNTAAIATEECIAVAYEQLSGRAMFIWGDAVATDNYYRIWDGATLTTATLLDIAAQGGVTNWITLKSQPNSNGLLLTVVDGGSDLNTAYWNGSAWTVHSEHDGAVDTNAARCADFAWSPIGSNGLLVWGTTLNSISYRIFTPPNTWSSTYGITAVGTHRWVQLRTNPRYVNGDVHVLGADLNSNHDIGLIMWDGATFTIIEGIITADTTVLTYECFEIAFMNFGPISTTYQLDLEIQWINVNHMQKNEHLCIYAGTLSSESLQVDVWTGSSWITLINALNTGWNNVSVSNYLTSNTFTIRFRDIETSNDGEQSSWQIDCALLHTWDDSYVQVEFTGIFGTQNWSELAWTVVCSSTIDSVNVTLQLYDYESGEYSPSGDGYASVTLKTEDTIFNQTITLNPTRFKDAGGSWKIKITGKGVRPFNLKIDFIEFKVTSSQCKLEISNIFTIDLSTYPLNYVYGLEIMIRYNVSEAAGRWHIKAYDWNSEGFSNAGFNTTEGNMPTANEWNDYTVKINENWTHYIGRDGAVQIMFCSEETSENQASVHIDFIGVRVILNGIQLDIKNSGATTAHIVSLWIINATHHIRYDVNFFVNPGENATYIRVDIAPPTGKFIVKIVTERGNVDTF